VPRKYSDKIWKEFKDACNKYFDKLKNTRTKTAEEIAALTIRNYILTLCAYELTGDHKTDLDAISCILNLEELWESSSRTYRRQVQ
jgi:hypothetical protein